MPQEIRLAYAKLLCLMLISEPQPGPVGLVELYHGMQGLQLKEKDRQVVLEFMLSPDADYRELCSHLLDLAGLEERNLIRFMLLDDLYRMMMSDHYESDREVAFFEHVANALDIRQEHLDLVRKTYSEKGIYLPPSKTDPFVRKAARQLIAGTAGIVVPLVLVAAIGEPGLSSHGITSGLRGLSPGYGKRRSFLPGLVIILAVGTGVRQATHKILRLSERRRSWMVKRLLKYRRKQLTQVGKYMTQDTRLVEKIIKSRASDFQGTDHWQELHELLLKGTALVEVMIHEPSHVPPIQ